MSQELDKDGLPIPTEQQSLHVMRCRRKPEDCYVCAGVLRIWEERKKLKAAKRKAKRSEVPHER